MLFIDEHAERDFIKSVLGEDILELSIDWIRANLDPEAVFSTKDLKQWAISNGFVEEKK